MKALSLTIKKKKWPILTVYYRQGKNYSQTSEARTRESSNTTENLNKNLGPDKKCS